MSSRRVVAVLRKLPLSPSGAGSVFVVEANTSVLAFAPMAVVASRASRTSALPQ